MPAVYQYIGSRVGRSTVDRIIKTMDLAADTMETGRGSTSGRRYCEVITIDTKTPQIQLARRTYWEHCTKQVHLLGIVKNYFSCREPYSDISAGVPSRSALGSLLCCTRASSERRRVGYVDDVLIPQQRKDDVE